MRTLTALSFFALAFSSQAFPQVTSGLLANWHFNEGTGTTVRDSSGSGRNGTVSQTPTWVTGVSGFAVDLSGTEAYVRVSSMPTPTSITLQAWVKPTSNAADSIIVNAGNSAYDLRIDSAGHLMGAVGGVCLTDSTFNFFASGNTGTWYFVVYTFDATTATHKLYRNGTLVASGTNSAKIKASGYPFWIGRHSQYNFGTFRGRFDEIAVYSRALTAAEIVTNYHVFLASPASIGSFTASPASITVGSSSTLSWVTSNATSVSISPSVSPAPVTGSATVTPQQTTTYTLTATGAGGSATASATITVTAAVPAADTTSPSVPTGLSATAVSSSQINVAWTASTDNTGVTSYRVYRNGSLAATVSATSFQDTGLAASATYSYTVSAQDAAGNSSAVSSAVAATTQAATTTTTTATGNGVTIKDRSGAGQTNRPFTISRVFAQGEFPAGRYPQARIGGSTGSTVLTQVDVKNAWADGSLRHALVSFAATVPAGGSIAVDFVSQTTANNTGYLDRAGMLAYSSSSWGAQMEATNSSTVKANARTMLTNWNGTDSGINSSGVRYWMKGPLVTQVIVEDRSPAMQYDIGWDTYRPLHPIFVLTFYPTSSYGVKVEYILENTWNSKVEDQTYSLALKTGSASTTSVYTKASFTHFSGTRWRKIFWSGTAPTGWTDAAHPGVAIDYNFAYIIASKALPSYDLSKTVDSGTIAAALISFNATDGGADINGSGEWTMYMPMTGGRSDIGLLPLWYIRYLYSMSSTDSSAPEMYKVMLGNAEVSGHVPIHAREGRTATGAFCGLSAACASTGVSAVTGFGRPPSIDAYPTGPTGNAAVGATGVSGWTPDTAHQGNYAYVPYLITGDWYFLEELYSWAANNFWVTPAGTTRYYQRHDDWGYIRDQIRGNAWSWRTAGEAGFMAPDGTPEQGYFRQKILNNIAIREGRHNITNGYGYSADQTKWQWGYNVAGAIRDMENAPRNANPLNFVDVDEYASMDGINTSITQNIIPQWQVNFLIIVAGHLEELGYPTTQYKAAIGRNFINQILNPAYNPYLVGQYRTPATSVVSGSTNAYFTSWAEVKAGFLASEQTRTSWLDASDYDVNDGYAHYARAAAQFLSGISDGSYTGDAAIAWLNANVCCQSSLNGVPKWAFVPRK